VFFNIALLLPADERCIVRFWHKADMAIMLSEVRFWG
jgi:hypothetical protein